MCPDLCSCRHGEGYLVDLGVAGGRIVEYSSFLPEAGRFRCERISVLMFLDDGRFGVDSFFWLQVQLLCCVAQIKSSKAIVYLSNLLDPVPTRIGNHGYHAPFI